MIGGRNCDDCTLEKQKLIVRAAAVATPPLKERQHEYLDAETAVMFTVVFQFICHRGHNDAVALFRW